MIELPDVERMIESIAGYTTGKTISAIRIDDPSVVFLKPRIVQDHLEHHAVDSVERHGRHVVLRFRSDYSLVFDMGDDGRLRLESQTAPPTERTRIRFQFAAGRELRVLVVRVAGRRGGRCGKRVRRERGRSRVWASIR